MGGGITEDEGSALKKRSGDYILTHGKPNESASISKESNQNRFRIYFESPPELDRVPKALRRNPNKRWRREDSGSIAPSAAGNNGREGTAATVETIEVVEEEEEEEVEEVEVKDAAAVAALAAVAGEEVAQTDAGDHKTKSEEDTKVPAVNGTVETAESISDGAKDDVVDDAKEEVETVGHTTDQVASGDQTNPTTSKVEVAAAQVDLGDVSMKTDVGEIQAMISELVDGAAAEVESQPAVHADSVEPNIYTVPASNLALKVTTEDVTAAGSTDVSAPTGVPSSPSKRLAEETQALADSAENMASAYKTRTRRRSSFSSVDSDSYPPETESSPAGPSLNRLSILYEESSRRLCFDAAIVDKVRIHRKEGRIEVMFINHLVSVTEEDNDGPLSLPKGILVSLKTGRIRKMKHGLIRSKGGNV